MHLKRLEIAGFKSFARKGAFSFDHPISAIVGPNGSGKSNIAESIRFVLGEQSQKRLRSQRGEDLIWNGSTNSPRANHASVTIVFDNKDRSFDIDYDEVSLKREVFRDGVNHYFINNSQVRLRDVIELLSGVHIGASGHHIISQGEADRILNANIKERRTIIEEALGLKIYQWKIAESGKKLNKTRENMKETESMRREIAPHIKFLEKQVDRVQKAQEMQQKLKDLYEEYLCRESIYISISKEQIAEDKKEPEKEMNILQKKLREAHEFLSQEKKNETQEGKLVAIYQELDHVRSKKAGLIRELGRIEGGIEYEKKQEKTDDISGSVPITQLYDLQNTINTHVSDALRQEDITDIKSAITKIKNALASFFDRFSKQETNKQAKENNSLEKEKNKIEHALDDMLQKEKDTDRLYDSIKKEIEEEKTTSHKHERNILEMTARKSELFAALEKLKYRQSEIDKTENDFKDEIKEGVVLVGGHIKDYENSHISTSDVFDEDRSVQERRRKDIEKIKIKLEDAGVGGSEDVLKEYKNVTERDKFLESELEDLKKSAGKLSDLISELSEKLDNEFKGGIMRINTQFQEFFMLMFGGGSAKLSVVVQKKRRRKDTDILMNEDDDSSFVSDMEEKEEEEGIDISVSLPHKKIKGLEMLSGGERALTSIALIFAVSQVNPPPFLVLDETDAALDEANSRKYGDILNNLSKKSQLIVVTHNRETMSRANILYGVTMGSDAVSKLLSVKFDEATTYAK